MPVALVLIFVLGALVGCEPSPPQSPPTNAAGPTITASPPLTEAELAIVGRWVTDVEATTAAVDRAGRVRELKLTPHDYDTLRRMTPLIGLATRAYLLPDRTAHVVVEGVYSRGRWHLDRDVIRLEVDGKVSPATLLRVEAEQLVVTSLADEDTLAIRCTRHEAGPALSMDQIVGTWQLPIASVQRCFEQLAAQADPEDGRTYPLVIWPQNAREAMATERAAEWVQRLTFRADGTVDWKSGRDDEVSTRRFHLVDDLVVIEKQPDVITTFNPTLAARWDGQTLHVVLTPVFLPFEVALEREGK